jgi:four helix bundle protein
MKITSFRDLRVWQLAMNLVELVYRLTYSFPKSEIYGLTSQIRRAAVSVPSNIAEGHTREHTGEYLHHLSMAQASLAELETQLEIATRLQYVSLAESKPIAELGGSLGRQLYALRNALLRKPRR